MQTYLELIEQIKSLQKEAEEIRLKELTDVIAEINEKIALYGIKKNELKFPETIDVKQVPSTNKTKTKLPPMYENPKTGDEWSGRGQKPKWLKKELESGFDIKDFLTNKPDTTKSDTETNPTVVNNTVDEPHNEESNLN